LSDKSIPRGLYAITDAELIPADKMVQAVARAIQGGAAMIQYRDKADGPERRRFEAQDLVTLCRPLGTPLIINDDVELAAEVGADGVHLGRDDGAVGRARALLGEGPIIGVSCYNELERAREAVADGADYVAFGSFFPSTTKPDAVRADTALLQAARAELSVPIVAIGGITPENGAALVEAGADLLAVITGVFGQEDVESAARAYSRLF
jgi:thiamine-phosphate pyrophosphorylase